MLFCMGLAVGAGRHGFLGGPRRPATRWRGSSSSLQPFGCTPPHAARRIPFLPPAPALPAGAAAFERGAAVDGTRASSAPGRGWSGAGRGWSGAACWGEPVDGKGAGADVREEGAGGTLGRDRCASGTALRGDAGMGRSSRAAPPRGRRGDGEGRRCAGHSRGASPASCRASPPNCRRIDREGGSRVIGGRACSPWRASPPRGGHGDGEGRPCTGPS